MSTSQWGHKAPTSWGEETPLATPFQLARQEWDLRDGAARVQAANWRLACFGALGLCFVLAAGLIYQSQKADVIPYVVEVQSDTGQVRLVGAPLEQAYEPTEEVKKYFLAQWVRDVRGLSWDKQVARDAILRAYKYVTTPQGKLMLDQYFEVARPLERQGEINIQVEVRAVVAQSPTAYQVEWIERTYGAGGVRQDEQAFTGIFTLVHQVPDRAETLKDNPLGLYVHHLSFTKRPVVHPAN